MDKVSYPYEVDLVAAFQRSEDEFSVAREAS
jgi:hypothetical protein